MMNLLKEQLKLLSAYYPEVKDYRKGIHLLTNNLTDLHKQQVRVGGYQQIDHLYSTFRLKK